MFSLPFPSNPTELTTRAYSPFADNSGSGQLDRPDVILTGLFLRSHVGRARYQS